MGWILPLIHNHGWNQTKHKSIHQNLDALQLEYPVLQAGIPCKKPNFKKMILLSSSALLNLIQQTHTRKTVSSLWCPSIQWQVVTMAKSSTTQSTVSVNTNSSSIYTLSSQLPKYSLGLSYSSLLSNLPMSTSYPLYTPAVMGWLSSCDVHVTWRWAELHHVTAQSHLEQILSPYGTSRVMDGEYMKVTDRGLHITKCLYMYTKYF